MPIGKSRWPFQRTQPLLAGLIYSWHISSHPSALHLSCGFSNWDLTQTSDPLIPTANVIVIFFLDVPYHLTISKSKTELITLLFSPKVVPPGRSRISLCSHPDATEQNGNSCLTPSPWSSSWQAFAHFSWALLSNPSLAFHLFRANGLIQALNITVYWFLWLQFLSVLLHLTQC